MRKEDFQHAGEVIIASPAYVHCAWCMTKFDLAPTQSTPPHWHFLADTYGWLCTTCYEIYKKGYTFFLVHNEFYYHLPCAVTHNIVPFHELCAALVAIQQNTHIQKVKKNDFYVGYEIAADQTCDICARTFV